ncbi:MAG: hypothetical protein JWP45_2027 [Mucilaginibacter sp.]|nr:hypothetical protein [Mucilaginibacter sp.]
MLAIISAKSQSRKWLPGHFTDNKGNLGVGLMRIDPSDHGPVKNEDFIQFKENPKANPIELSAGDLRSIVIGKDSFVVAHVMENRAKEKNGLGFVRVVLDEDVKLYAAKDERAGGRGGISFGPEVGAGIGFGGGGGGFGWGLGGGISIPLGGHGSRNSFTGGYYFGADPAEMKPLTNENFQDVMTDIMGDYPEVVNKIAEKVYNLDNIDQLIAYYRQVKAADNSR